MSGSFLVLNPMSATQTRLYSTTCTKQRSLELQYTQAAARPRQAHMAVSSSFMATVPFVLLCIASVSAQTYDNNQWRFRTRPYVIGHRGSPAYVPEHSAASYELAISAGVDFIECDVVWTKDLVPICRHEPYLSLTTNVLNTTLASKRKSYSLSGFNITDVFSNDLTWDEIKTLRVIQQDSFRPQMFNGQFRIISLEEHIEIAQNADRTVGIYPELKHPSFFNEQLKDQLKGRRVGDILLDVLTKWGYAGNYNSPNWRRKPVFVQCFEQDELVYFSQKSCIPLVQLFFGPGTNTADRNKTYEQMISDASLDDIATYATGAGPAKTTTAGPVNGTIVNTGLVARLQRRGMQVHHYTLRPEAQYIFPQLGNLTAAQYNEYDLYFKAVGIDGSFHDAPALLAGYMAAQETANMRWPAAAVDRWNAVPTTCKVGTITKN